MSVENSQPLRFDSIPLVNLGNGSKSKRKMGSEKVSDITKFALEELPEPSKKKLRVSTFTHEEDTIIKYLQGRIKSKLNWVTIAIIFNQLNLGTTKSKKQLNGRYTLLKHHKLNLLTDADNVIIEKYKDTMDKLIAELPEIKQKKRAPIFWQDIEIAIIKYTTPKLNNTYKSISNILKKFQFNKTAKECSDKYFNLKNKSLTELEDNLLTTKMKEIIDNSLKKFSKSPRRKWNSHEITILIKGVVQFKQNWTKIEEFLKANGVNRTKEKAESRFNNLSDKELKEYTELLDEENSKSKKNLKVELPVHKEPYFDVQDEDLNLEEYRPIPLGSPKEEMLDKPDLERLDQSAKEGDLDMPEDEQIRSPLGCFEEALYPYNG